ncbi:MAG: hypothetical protein AB7F96_02215 [Beijerinckiaceae bacterium]
MNTNADPLHDDLLASEERRAALSYVTEAFAEAVRDGIEGDCFAQAALFAAFQELVAVYGEEAVALYAEKLPDRIRHGSFTTAARH